MLKYKRMTGNKRSVRVQENKQEIRSVWNMFKQDPLAPAGAYWRTYGMPGIGLFLEGYVVSVLHMVAGTVYPALT